jgi:hypothetical protein
MGLQKGGHRLKRELRREFSGDLFGEYILPMIRDKDTKFEILNTSSMYGFVVVMTVNISISNFVNDDEEPVNEFVIKICELNSPNSKCVNTLRKAAVPGGLFKKSLSYNMFLLEGKTQQKIWGERLEHGLKPICPAFTSLKIINEPGLILELVNTLFQSNGEIVNYLSSEITTYSYDLGFMMMEKIDGVVLKSVYKGLESTARFICAIAITLYLEHNVINIDLNQGNLMLNVSTENLTMIDYGQVMTPDFLTYCVNSRGDTMKTINPRETFMVKEQKYNLTEFQKLQLFFEKGRHQYDRVNSEARVASMLTFLVHMESRFLFMLYGPMANSNMTQIVEIALRGDHAYTDILKIYLSLSKREATPKTPLKESMKVGYTEEVPSVERPLMYVLTGPDLTKAEAEYKSMWIPANTGKAVPSAEEFAQMVENMRGQLSDDIAFQDAMKFGTPGSECTLPDNPPPHSGSTIVDNSADFNPLFSPHSGSTIVDNSADFNPLFSPHSGSTQVDVLASSSSDFEPRSSGNEDIQVEDVLVKPRPYEAKRKPFFYPVREEEEKEEEKVGGKNRRHKKTIRKRKTARHLLRKRKTRRQRKQKTRKKYTKIRL